MTFLPLTRLPTWSFWVTALLLAACSQIYLFPKTLNVSDGQDFRLIWLAGQVWMSGESPYSEAFDLRYFDRFGSQRASHFWVYPPYWSLLAMPLGRLDFEDALLIWNLVGYLALWAGVTCLVFALRIDGWRRLMPCVLILGSVASLLQATSFALSLGQTSLLLFLGAAFFISGSMRHRNILVFLGLLLTMMKPQVGILFVTFAMLQPTMRSTALLALALLTLAALPAVLVTGIFDAISGFVGNLAAYNSSGAVANLPEHLVGLQKILSLVSISVTSTLPILTAAVGIVVAQAAGMKRQHLLLLTTLLALFVTGLHTYDLTLVLCLVPFAIGVRGWSLAALTAGFVLIARPANLATFIAFPVYDSDIFPGSIHATVGLLLLVAALGGWRMTYR